MAFGASIKGFQYCCPLISINDTHLYDNYKANFFIVVAYDTNNRVYLLSNKRSIITRDSFQFALLVCNRLCIK